MMKTITKYSKSAVSITFIYFFLLSFLFRLPFFFEAVISGDESTFILTGQSLLDGNLPYTELWDLKPPLLPAAFALFIALFGKSIVSIRIAGATCVALTSWFTYLIGSTIKSHRAGLISGTLSTVSLSALDYDFFSTMSEHVAIVPLMGAVLILLQKRITSNHLFWSGILLATAAMMRLNLAYVILAAGIFVALFLHKNKHSSISYIRTALARVGIYSLGVFLVIFLTLMPYVITGKTLVWWQSVVLAPLSYSDSRPAYQVFSRLISKISRIIFDWSIVPLHPPSDRTTIAILVCLGALLGILKIIVCWKNFSSCEKRNIIIITLFFASTSFSILNGGKTHLHYLIQVMPFLSLYAAPIYEPVFAISRLRKTIPIVATLVVLILSGSLKKYEQNLHQGIAGETLFTGPAYEVADYFRELDTTKKSIYMMNSHTHITYWLIDKKPLTRSSTHPSNISKEYLLKYSIGQGATVESALLEILEQKPDFIVTQPDDIWYLKNYTYARALLDDTLGKHYKLVKQIQKIQIYQRDASYSTK